MPPDSLSDNTSSKHSATGHFARPTTAELAEVLLKLFQGRKTAYALRRGVGYVVAKTKDVDVPLTIEAVEGHLNGTQPIGVYLLEKDSDECHFGVFDIDDHDGVATWDGVSKVSNLITRVLTACGLRHLIFKSGGGKGIHVVVPFSGPVKAALLRKTMKQVLKSNGFKDGSGGVIAKEVEVFPKQDAVKGQRYGNLVALPLARQSILLDDQLAAIPSGPLEPLRAFLPNKPSTLKEPSPASAANVKSKGVPISPSADAQSEHPLSKCIFIQHCESEAGKLAEPLWYAAACNLASTENGRAYFHKISALDVSRYDEALTESKFAHAMESAAPHTCAKISELGFACPKMKPDGQCSVTGGRHPVSFVKTIPELIATLRVLKPPAVKHRKIAAVVLDSLNLEGTFYAASDDRSLHYFYNKEKKLYAVSGNDFEALCCELFGMNASEPEYRFVLSAIETYANRSGKVVDFYRFARFTEKGILYINAGSNQAFRLDGKEIEIVDNGTDGILFRNSAEVEPIQVAAGYAASPVQEHLVGALHCESKPLHHLYWVFIYALFFERLLPTKPIVLITGEKGSGKSFTGRALKQALFGRASNVDTGLTSDEKNAKAAFANNYFLCMDNVDGKITWMANLLASVSTGTLIKERKLYENNVEVAFTPRCFVMINSREPTSLKRDDVVDRLLILPVERYGQFVSEAELLDRIARNRGALWSELLGNLNKIVLRLQKGIPAAMTDQRLADFANLGLLIAGVIKAKEAKKAFMQLEEARNAMVLEDHPLLTALKAHIGRHPVPEWIGTGKLLEEIKRHDYTYAVKSPQYFGQQLNILSSNLRGYLDIEFREGAHNIREVRVGHLGQFTQPLMSPKAVPPSKKPGTTVTTKSKTHNLKERSTTIVKP